MQKTINRSVMLVLLDRHGVSGSERAAILSGEAEFELPDGTLVRVRGVVDGERVERLAVDNRSGSYRALHS